MIQLDHIGIAVNDLPRVQKLFSILGLKVDGSEMVDEQGVRVHFLKLPLKPSQIELLEVQDPQGTVAKFISKRGPGVHHLSFLVKNGELDELSEQLKAAGYQLTYPAPKMGAHHMRINFIHPASAGGLLIEIMEPTKP